MRWLGRLWLGREFLGREEIEQWPRTVWSARGCWSRKMKAKNVKIDLCKKRRREEVKDRVFIEILL